VRKERKHYSPEEKVAILRRHLLDQVPVSDLCEGEGLQPTAFYRWQKEFFENGAAPSSPRNAPPVRSRRSRNGSSFWRRRFRPKMRSWPN
jgi:transposase